MLAGVKDIMLMAYPHEPLVDCGFNEFGVHLKEGDWTKL